MKKSLLSKSAVALATGMLAMGAAQAIVVGPAGGDINLVAPATQLVVNASGLGHSLLVPYYTAQGGNDTYLSIVNTDMRNGKAVKIRFRGASNSDDVLDFTILLSPGDVWAAAISKPTGQDLPKLTTSDKSCTLPAIPQNGVNFNPARLHQKLTAAQQASETREGYVEIFNMADIPPQAAVANETSANRPLYRSIEHVSGTPRGCTDTSVTALLSENFVTLNNYAAAQLAGLEVPSTGLMANWSIVNVPNATSWSGAATAIEAQTAAFVPGYGNIVLFPQIDTVNIDAATARPFTSDALLRGGAATNIANEVPGAQVVTALPVDFPDMSTPYLNADLANLGDGVATKSQTSRLMASFATLSTANEFNTLAAVSGKNDWTFTMPTRRYNVVRSYDNAGANESAGTTLFTNLTHNDANAVIAGNNDYFVSGTQVVSNTVEGKRHQLCVTGITFSGGVKGGAASANNATALNSAVTADREETFVAAGSNGAVFSPSVPGTPASFCGEASVLTFNNLTALSPEVAKRDIGTPTSEGWARFAHANGNLGLPVLGSSFVQFTNNAATPGVKGNYGLAWPHRTSVR